MLESTRMEAHAPGLSMGSKPYSQLLIPASLGDLRAFPGKGDPESPLPELPPYPFPFGPRLALCLPFRVTSPRIMALNEIVPTIEDSYLLLLRWCLFDPLSFFQTSFLF